MKDSFKKAAQNLLLLLIGCVFAFAVTEIILRIYNPFAFNVKGNKIILEANAEHIIKNNQIKKLDRIITTRKNSIGFRGEEPPKALKNYLTIITIGGSTTECSLLSEGKTWTDDLELKLKEVFKQLWINNAGLEGHSTVGHIFLMRNHILKIKPKVVLFLVGANDIGQNQSDIDNEIMKQGVYFKSTRSFLVSMANHSEVFAVALNFYRYFNAAVMGATHKEINLNETTKISEEVKANLLQRLRDKFLKGYEKRLNELIQISNDNGIIPVFITQSALYGDTIDDVTNIDLANVRVNLKTNGKFAWEKMELYNEVLRQTGKSKGVLVIDLAKEMPKSSRYYYDWTHYTNEGAEKAAGIIYKFLCPFLAKKFNEYSVNDCNISASGR